MDPEIPVDLAALGLDFFRGAVVGEEAVADPQPLLGGVGERADVLGLLERDLAHLAPLRPAAEVDRPVLRNALEAVARDMLGEAKPERVSRVRGRELQMPDFMKRVATARGL